MTHQHDALIIGAGIAGIAVGQGLAKRGLKVLILEKEAMEGTGATGCSAGGIRQQFSDPAKILASSYSRKVFDEFQERFDTDPGFLKTGYLLIRTDEMGAKALKADAALQQSMGLNTRYLPGNEAKGIVPALNTSDLKGASFNESDGILDPHAVLQGYLNSYRNLGGRIEYLKEVKGLLQKNNRVTGVVLEDQEVLADHVICAMGPHSGAFLKRMGMDLPLRPCRRQIFATGPVPGVDPNWPLVIDEGAPFYFRPETGGVIMSLAEVDEMQPPESGNEIPLSRRHLDLLAEKASHRCPLLEEAEIRSGWAGLRTLTPDHRPLLGPAPGMPGLHLATGFSGHGITLSPFASDYLAKEITNQPFEDSLRSPFSASRSFEGK